MSGLETPTQNQNSMRYANATITACECVRPIQTAEGAPGKRRVRRLARRAPRHASWVVVLALLAVGLAHGATPMGTAFTYQGQLNDGGAPANGNYDFHFAIYDAPAGGTASSRVRTTSGTGVSNGMFTTTLDFGTDVFMGDARWLEIGVRTNGTGAFVILEPRQPLTPAPYALFAPNAGQLTGTLSPANIVPGSLTTAMLAPGAVESEQLAAGAVTTRALADGAVTGAKLATASNWFALTIPNPTPAYSEAFGVSVAGLGTDGLLIGAAGDETGAGAAGAVYLFNTNGTLLTTFTNPTPALAEYFGVSVAAMGTDRVLIGALNDNTGVSGSGAGYLFSTGGVLITTFTNPTPVALDEFGRSVAAVGSDRVLIGAPSDDTGAGNTGAAYLFSTNGALLATFTNPTPAVNENFGQAVAAVGVDCVLIGAFNAGWQVGAAYLFSTNGTLITTFTNPTPAFDDEFGISVAAVGTDRVLIGAYQDDTAAQNSGAAYLFRTNGALIMTFTNPAPASSDWFGRSVAAAGDDRVLIGASGQNTGAGWGSGVAYVFSTNGTLLAALTNPTPAYSEWFGSSVAAVGADRVVIGAYEDSTGALWTGTAYLFSLQTYTPGLIADAVTPGSIVTASLEDGAVTATKIGGVLYAKQIPELDAAKIASGNLADARLSANVALRAGGNAFTGNQTVMGGSVGIGTASPEDAILDVEGDARLNMHELYLREGNDRNHGLGWYGASKLFGDYNVDGPVLYGFDGGGLGTMNGGQGLALHWNYSGNVAIDPIGLNPGALTPGLTFGWDSGEGISSKRTAGGHQYGLDFYTSFQKRLSLAQNGNLALQGVVDTLGSTSLDLHVNGTRGLRLEQGMATNGAPNLIGGAPLNWVAAGVIGATIAGGGATNDGRLALVNSVAANFGAIGGGNANSIAAAAEYGTIAGGRTNSIAAGARHATIAGGHDNHIGRSADNDAIGGGYANDIATDATFAVIGGGAYNGIGTNADSSFIGGGYYNKIAVNATYATIPGGDHNAAGDHAFAAGRQAKANHQGAFVWGDSTVADIASTNANSVTMRASGGYRLFSNSGATVGAYLAPGGGSWTAMSDRNAKENFTPVDPEKVLEHVTELPLSTWNYKSQDAAIRHMGPMAQDFKAAFNVGESDTGITTIDADGVALAAIQGLNRKLEAKEAQINALEMRLQRLEKLLSAKEDRP